MTCPRHSALGTGCDLPTGHDGDHQRIYDDGRTVTWSEDTDRRFVEAESRKKQGT